LDELNYRKMLAEATKTEEGRADPSAFDRVVPAGITSSKAYLFVALHMDGGGTRSTQDMYRLNRRLGEPVRIIERMRGNRGELDAYVAEDIGSAPPAAGTDCRLVACTSGQLAEHDLSQWTLRLTGADELVSIDGSKFDTGGLLMPRACISSNSREVSVAIAWRGTGKIIDGSDSDCGKSSALYGPENEQRRVLVLTTYIGRT